MSTAAATCSAPDVSGGYVAFLRELPRFLRTADSNREPCGLIIVHLCNLNRINSAAGYPVGRRMSFVFADELKKILRDEDWMTPLTADRYAIVLGRVRNAGHLMLAANRIARIAAEISIPDNANLALEARAGAALFPEHGKSGELLLRNAELAVEAAARGKVDFAIYEPEIFEEMSSGWDLEAELGPGLANGEFEMFYQPKVEAATLLPCGAEALMRWHSPRLGNISPDRFIALAENADFIDALTTFALHSAARAAAEWGAGHQHLGVAINLSPSIINRGNVVSSFEQVSAIWGIDLERFTAEVTENGIIATGAGALRVLNDLRDAGVRVSIDDFGTGNSSLAYFKDLPADELKIDKSFVFAMLDSDANFRMVKTIIDLAHGFDLKVVAEGVENPQCVERLQQLGCDVLQGYHFSRPVPQDAFIHYLQSQQPDRGQ
jgi:EAL domain-containing protein (putative c-di-GMP-specific phosphodiesterase class I)/GGDEF domain-containing protein